MSTQLSVINSEMVAANGEAIPSPWFTRMEQHGAWPTLSRIELKMTVRIALDRLKVRTLLELREGQILTSQVAHTKDVPLTVGEVRLGWSEFEVSGQRIGVRLTQLA
ncbi:MAG: surface presentation of antigen (SpoA) protein [Acidobacteriaceae bacterium]|nr:surface presentation of antigen (SpoA) protein [Acidobacteriaceae bacterium]